MKSGKIIIEKGVKNITSQEMHIALALKELGYTIKFIKPHNSIRTADAYVNNVLFEFKSPEGDNIKCVENRLSAALRYQSKNVVIDSCRMKKVQDRSIRNYLIARVKRKKGIKRLFFVDRSGQAIDITALVR